MTEVIIRTVEHWRQIELWKKQKEHLHIDILTENISGTVVLCINVPWGSKLPQGINNCRESTFLSSNVLRANKTCYPQAQLIYSYGE